MNRLALPTRIVLVRHGQIPANVEQIWHGSTDQPLTPRGQEEARLAAGLLQAQSPRPAALYTSPLMRARQTARAISEKLALQPRVEPGLSEYGIGELEGESYLSLAREHRFFHKILADFSFAPPGGESLGGVVERTVDALRRIAAAHEAERVVVVGHGAALALGLARLLDDDPKQWQRYQQSNCAVSELELDPTPRLTSFNETSHLLQLRDKNREFA